MLSFSRIISAIVVVIFFISCNAVFSDELDVIDYSKDLRKTAANNLDDGRTFFGEKIMMVRQGFYDLYEIINGDAFNFDIVVDEQGLQLLNDKLTEMHPTP